MTRSLAARLALVMVAGASGLSGCGEGDAKECHGAASCIDADATDGSADVRAPRDARSDEMDRAEARDDARTGEEKDGRANDASEAPDARADAEDEKIDAAEAPRPIAPLSTARVTSQTPTLRWALPDGITGAVIDLCRDRACTKSIVPPARVTGTSFAPASELPAGVVYWRLHPDSATTSTSPTWQFIVGARSASLDVSWGTTLDVNGDGYADLAAGAPGASSSSGAVYVYRGGLSGLASASDSLLDPDGAAGDAFGASVSSAGDVDGDGYANLVVGAPGASGGKGKVYVYGSGPSGVAATPVTLSDPGDVSGDAFGASVSSAGDVNGDGYADLVVGAPGSAGSEGVAYLFFGGPSGLTAAPVTLSDPGGAAGDAFGASVSSAGDVNDDGFGDLVVGAPGAASFTGEAYVYLGGASGAGAPLSLTDPGNAAGDSFGASVTSSGDANGDGYADVVVAAYDASSATGNVYVYYGGSAGVATLPTTLDDPSEIPGSSFGASVASAGDMNGDGYVDLAVGAPATASSTASVYVFLGGPPSALGPLVATLDDPAPATADGFGSSVASAGDVDGDGYADLAVGAEEASSATGKVYVFPGGSPNVGTPFTRAGSSGAGSRFGASIFGGND